MDAPSLLVFSARMGKRLRYLCSERGIGHVPPLPYRRSPKGPLKCSQFTLALRKSDWLPILSEVHSCDPALHRKRNRSDLNRLRIGNDRHEA